MQVQRVRRREGEGSNRANVSIIPRCCAASYGLRFAHLGRRDIKRTAILGFAPFGHRLFHRSRRNQHASDAAAEHKAHAPMNRIAACARLDCFKYRTCNRMQAAQQQKPVCAAIAPVVRIQQSPAPSIASAHLVTQLRTGHRILRPAEQNAARARCIRAQAP